MKNWSIKLILSLVTATIFTLVLAYILNKFGIDTFLTCIIGGMVIFGGIMWKLKTFNKSTYGFALGIIASATSFVGSQWLFHSANTTVEFANLDEYLATPEKPLYFTLADYYVDYDGVGDAEITTTRKRRGISSKSVDNYLAIPIFSDTTTTEIKAWITNSYSKEKYDAAEDYDALLNMEGILYFETIYGPDEDLQTAIDYSEYKQNATPNAVMMYPRYAPYITKTVWAYYFAISLVAGCAIVAIFGIFIERCKLRQQAEIEATTDNE